MWTVGLLLSAVAGSIVAWMEIQRDSANHHQWWEPVSWEFSSALMLLALAGRWWPSSGASRFLWKPGDARCRGICLAWPCFR